MAHADLSPAADKIFVETVYREKDLIKAVPGATWNAKQGLWQVPVSWGACVILRGVFGEHLTIGPELNNWAVYELANRVQPSLDLRESLDMPGSDKLYPYQRAGAEWISVAKRCLLTDGLGAGKAQPLSEPVLTPSGFVPMGDIKQGDYVIGSNGKPTLVYGTYRQGVRPVYKISFSDGTFAYADQDHLWRVQSLKNHHDNFWQVLSTAELLRRGVDTELPKRGLRHHKWRVPFVRAVEFETVSDALPLDPYVLGVLLGDGSLLRSAVGFSSADEEIVKRVADSLPAGVHARIKPYKRNSDTQMYGVTLTTGQNSHPNPVLDTLRVLGVQGHRAESKFVPRSYLHASSADRLEILRGLMDTDGYAGKNNGASFSSASAQLADDVAFLARSLGGRAEITVSPVKPGGNFPTHSVMIRMPDDANPFYLGRKAARIRSAVKYFPAKFMSAIEYSHEEETQCIAVDASDHCYVTRDFIVTHNTRQALFGIMRLYQKGENPFPILCVVPNSTKIGWQREAAEVWPDLEVVVVKGSAAERRKQLETPAHMYVINWEAMRSHSRLAAYGSIALKRCKECGGEDERITWAKCHVHKRELNQLKFQTVILDEAHRSKDPTSQQTRACFAAAGDAPFRIAMTGTPIADAPDDLWTILHFLDPQEHPSRTRYIDRFAELSYNAFGAPTVVGLKPAHKEEFFKIVDPRLRRMPKDLVLRHLPPVVHERRDVDMSTKQAKAYKQMAETMLAELDNGEILTTTSPLTRVTRLLQFASSYAELEEKIDEATGKITTRVRLADPSNKIDAFMNDLPDFAGDGVVVFSPSRQLIELLSARFEKNKIEHGLVTGAINEDDRQHHIDQFQAGKTQFVLATTGAGGVGLTLTAGRVGVFLSRPWSSVESVQAEGRVHRIGSERHKSISIIDYVTPNTVEETVHAALRAKGERLEELLRDRDLLRRLLGGDFNV